jgi:uncharacterized repeat protein (TIGR01451 family)
VVTDAITSLPQVVSASWTCTPAGGATCAPGPAAGDLSDTANIPAGGSVTYTLVATLASGATGDLVNVASATLSSVGSDPDPANNSATDTDARGAPSADIAIVKSDGVTSYLPGGQVTYTITVSNAGPSDVAGIVVTDEVTALPQVQAASWSCAGAAGAICSSGPTSGDINDSVSLRAGASVTYTLVVDIAPGATGDLVNTASVAVPSGATDPTRTPPTTAPPIRTRAERCRRTCRSRRRTE